MHFYLLFDKCSPGTRRRGRQLASLWSIRFSNLGVEVHPMKDGSSPRLAHPLNDYVLSSHGLNELLRVLGSRIILRDKRDLAPW